MIIINSLNTTKLIYLKIAVSISSQMPVLFDVPYTSYYVEVENGALLCDITQWRHGK